MEKFSRLLEYFCCIVSNAVEKKKKKKAQEGRLHCYGKTIRCKVIHPKESVEV